MTDSQAVKCNSVIHSASAACAAVGAGLAQLPVNDNAINTPIQLAMAVGLAKTFGLELQDASVKAALASASANVVRGALPQVVIGGLPIAGNIVNAITAASLTEAIGWIMANEFEKQSLKA